MNIFNILRREIYLKSDYVDLIAEISYSTMISISRLKQIIFEDSEPTDSELEKLIIFFRYSR